MVNQNTPNDRTKKAMRESREIINNKRKIISVYTPVYKKVGVDHKGNPQFEVSMKEIGQANSYADAKAKFGVLAIVDGYAREMEEE